MNQKMESFLVLGGQVFGRQKLMTVNVEAFIIFSLVIEGLKI